MLLCAFARRGAFGRQRMRGRRRSSGPHNLPAPDLLNMKGVDRPTPLKDVTIEQRLNSQLPLDAAFRDEDGQTFNWASISGSGRWCWRWSITSARCCARRS